MNSGRVSTAQTFFQVGKSPKSTQFIVPTPSPSSAGGDEGERDGGEIEVHVQALDRR